MSKLREWIDNNLYCPDCGKDHKLYEFEVPKDNFSCPNCNSFWRLAIEKGLVLVQLYPDPSKKEPLLDIEKFIRMSNEK